MSRSGYSEDCDGWALIRWRGAVNSAIKGGRGQRLLRDMAAALDAMSNKRLIAEELQRADGEVCALGAVARAKGLDVSGVEPWDRDGVAKTFGIARALAAEIAYLNDDDGCFRHDTPEQRWHRVRAWVMQNIREPNHE